MNAKPLTESVVKKIQMAKFLYELGVDCFRVIENPERIGAGIVLLQDSVEVFLLAVCEYLDVPLGNHVDFDKYFVELGKKINEEVPLKKKMLILNRQRIGIKHHGYLPSIDDCRDFPTIVREFFEELATRYLNIDIDSITLIDLLNEGKPKELLKQAENCLKSGNHKGCQIDCRKALYLTFEKRFDIRPFEKAQKDVDFLTIMFCEAPDYAQNKEFIESHVREPTDYILIDHGKLEKDLLLNGIPAVDFWNIWRLTPALYYYEEDEEWAIKDEFEEGIYNEENAEYCLRKMVEILLLKQRYSEKTKYVKKKGKLITIKGKKTKLFEKASVRSKVTVELEHGPAQIHSFGRVRGLEDRKYYYYVVDRLKKEGKAYIVHGYICEDDVENL